MSKLRKQFISSNCRLRASGPTAMYCKIAFTALAVFFIGNDFVAGQEQIPPTTTAAELWNPWTWFWPYAIATAEGYRDYYKKAQQATNELYQQIYKTNAFPWVTGNWGPPQNNPGGNSQNGGNPQNNQDNQNNQNNQNNQDNQNNQNNQNNQDNQNNQNNQNNQDNQDNQNNQNNQDNQDNQNNQNNQDNQGGDNEQNNPTDNQPNNEDKGQEEPSQDDTPANETDQNKPGAQIQGGAQGDGTADAEVNGKVQ